MRLLRFGLVVVLLSGVVSATAFADFVFMTDGYTLEGKLKKEGELFSDAGNEYWVPKLGYVMDDGVRRFYFHQRIVSESQRTPDDLDPKVESFKLKQPINQIQNMPYNIRLDRVAPWQENGKRVVDISTSNVTKVKIDQFITEVTPTLIQTKARDTRWNMPLLVSEIKPAELFDILNSHPDALGKDPRSLGSRLRLLRFCIDAGLLDEADKQRQELAKLPLGDDDVTRLATLGTLLDRKLAFRTDQWIQLAQETGQHQRAQQLLDTAKDEAATDRVLSRLRAARVQYKQRNADLESLRRLLNQARKASKSPTLQNAAKPILDEMEQSLNLDTGGRLEVFLRLADQEERLKSQDKEPEYTPDQLLALAVSGWLLGAKGADAKETYCIQLCQARDILQRYLKAGKLEERKSILYQYQRGQTLRVDEIAQLLENLPPILPEPNPTVPVLERLTPKSEYWPAGVRYQIKHPPEYHPHRNYPLLIVLTNPVGADSRLVFEWWGPWAAKYGYLLAVPEWMNGTQKDYEYSPREHAAVMETIRDIRRHYSVDGERIALAGYDRGGTMCYDVALSHADQFAAAVTFCADTGKHARNLQNNGQYLPFYVVDGEKDFLDRPKKTRLLFDHWLLYGFPSVYCEYFQRGYEDYYQELPFVFDWIHRKRLAKGLPDLGVEPLVANLGKEMRSVRPTDNRFYWITGQVTATPENPALLTAAAPGSSTKQLPGNTFQIRAKNFKELSVWLSPAMVDFEQPVEIKVNPGSNGPSFKKQVKPSLEVMLEDFYERGDRHTLYFAKVVLDLTKR